jgi:hypothetical protein
MKVIRFENCDIEEDKVKLCVLFLTRHFEITNENVVSSFSLDGKKVAQHEHGQINQQLDVPF